MDRYAELLRGALAPRLAEPRPRAAAAPRASLWGARGRFAVALTHDLDNLWRWTRRGFAAAGYRTARAARRLERPRRRAASSATAPTGSSVTSRAAPTPSGPSRRSSRGEDVRGVSSTFYVIARHTHKQDGNQPETYRRRIPEALRAASPRPAARSACTATTPTASRSPRSAGDRADLAGTRGPAPSPASATTTCARSTTRRCRCWSRPGSRYDTTLAFAEHEGFRCGCSFPFRPYSLAEERPLDLVELPLAVMDGTLQEPHYRGLAAADAERAAASVLARALRSGGAVSLLWHNNRFDRRVSRGYDKVYWRLRRPGAGARRLVRQRRRRRRPLEGGDARDPRPAPQRRPQAGRPAHLRARVPHAGAGGLRGHVHGAGRGARRATTPA